VSQNQPAAGQDSGHGQLEHGLRTDLAERGRVERPAPRAPRCPRPAAPRHWPRPTNRSSTLTPEPWSGGVGTPDRRPVRRHPPELFIPVAESTALIRPLGVLVLDRA